MADLSRRRILDLLRAGPQTTGQFRISRIAVMRHLAVLSDAGLVASRGAFSTWAPAEINRARH